MHTLPAHIELNMIANRIAELAPDLRGDLIDTLNIVLADMQPELHRALIHRLAADSEALARLHAFRDALETV